MNESLKPKIKECFFRTSDGKCCSPEIYRFIEGMESGKPCPFAPELDVFYLGTPFENMYRQRCLEFRPKEEAEK